MEKILEELKRQINLCEAMGGEGLVMLSVDEAREIVEALKSREWVRVKEKQPDKFTEVLAFSPEYYAKRPYVAWVYKDGLHPNITHWQQLPKPPQTQEGEE